MRSVRMVGLVGVVGSMLAGCGSLEPTSDDAAPLGAETVEETAATTTSIDPDRFGDFPSAPGDGWLIGTAYERTSLVDRQTGLEVGSAEVGVTFFGRSQISVGAAGCGVGSGGFTLVDGRVTDPELAVLAVGCTPTEADVLDAVGDLMLSDPEIRAEGSRLLLLSDRYRLELEAAEPGIDPIIGDFERFVAVDSTVVGIEPSRIELASPSLFVVKVIVPTCEIFGGISNDQAALVAQPDVGFDPCEFAPDADRAARAFFAEGAAVLRDGTTLELANTRGMIRFRLATDQDQPMATETTTPPKRTIPEKPDRTQPAEAGRVSVPWYALRAGTAGPGGMDLPIPEGWEARDPTTSSVSAAGRGSFDAYVIAPSSLPWNPELSADGLDLVEGPTDVTVKLYRLDGDVVVESGATATARQYRYGSADPDTWLRKVVWVIERNGVTTMVSLAFPEFPDDSSFAGPDDSINLSLTGLDPIDLLEDVRFFE